MVDDAASPFTTGVVRNIIILPNGNLNKTDLKYILKHEAVHCKNKDILWKSFFLAVNIVHWFNPFVWLLRKFAEQDMEIACDEEVVMNSSMENRREYSDVIMAWVGRDGYKGHVLSTGYVHGVRFLKWRFDNIFNNEYKNKGNVLIGGALVLILLFSSIIHIKNGGKTYAVKKVPVDYGIEVRTDISGDAKTDRVWVVDTVSGDYAFTQVCAALNDGSDFFIDYPDSWASSYLVTGDLNGNGAADVVVLRYDMGSTYGGCAVSVLHMGKNDLGEDDFEEYPSVFIQNPEFGAEQPVGFGEEDWFSCIGASIIEKNGKTMLRLIACVDVMNDIAQCIDCSYQVDGWYIEEIQLVSDYWRSDKQSALLGYSY